MPKLSHAVPSYRRHRQSGQAIVTLNGRDHLLGPYGTRTSQRAYDRLIGEWLQRGREPLVEPSALTVAEVVARYWKFARTFYVKGGRPTQEQGVIKMALRPLLQLYKDQTAAGFGPLALKSVRNEMLKLDWTRQTVNKQIDRIRRMFRWAVSEELLPVETYQRLTAVRGLAKGRTEAREAEPVKPIDGATIEATLPHLPDVVADMVRLQCLTGMRPAELCMIRPMDIDRSADTWRYVPESHKCEHHNRDRVVFIGPQAQAVLLRYLARDAEAYCFRPCDSEAKRRAAVHAARRVPLSCGNKPGSNRKRKPKRSPGDRYDSGSYRRAIHRACDKVGISRWSPNRLRHTFATQVRKSYGLEAVQVCLGHARADVSQVYAERDATLAARVAREVG